MKHTIEVYPDFSNLKEYLSNIEKLAAQLGVEVDELLSEDLKPLHQLKKKRRALYIEHFSSTDS